MGQAALRLSIPTRELHWRFRYSVDDSPLRNEIIFFNPCLNFLFFFCLSYLFSFSTYFFATNLLSFLFFLLIFASFSSPFDLFDLVFYKLFQTFLFEGNVSLHFEQIVFFWVQVSFSFHSNFVLFSFIPFAKTCFSSFCSSFDMCTYIYLDFKKIYLEIIFSKNYVGIPPHEDRRGDMREGLETQS